MHDAPVTGLGVYLNDETEAAAIVLHVPSTVIVVFGPPQAGSLANSIVPVHVPLPSAQVHVGHDTVRSVPIGCALGNAPPHADVVSMHSRNVEPVQIGAAHVVGLGTQRRRGREIAVLSEVVAGVAHEPPVATGAVPLK